MPVQEVAVLPAAHADDDLDVARVAEDRELILWYVGGPPGVGSVVSLAPG